MPTERFHPRGGDLPDMSADQIAGRRFAQSWRGYDQTEVKQFLAQVAAQVQVLSERLGAEAAARREAEQRASHPHIDEAVIMSAVGEETAGILRSARSAAAEITAKAETQAASTVRAAEAKAAELVAEAENLMAARRAEAEAVAAQVRSEAEAAAAQVLSNARAEADKLKAQAVEEHRQMVETAQSTRERVLSDLARRRKLATVQIEQLRAGRERLLDAYLVVRRTLDEVTEELQRADAEARAVAGAVGRQVASGATDEPVDLHVADGPEGANTTSAEPAAERTGGGNAEQPVRRPLTVTSSPGSSTPPVVLAPKAAQLAAAGASFQGLGAPGAPVARVSPSDTIESVRILRGESTGPAALAQVPPAQAPAAQPAPVEAGTVEAGTVEAGTVEAGTVEAGTVEAGAGSPRAEGPAIGQLGATRAGSDEPGTAQASPDQGDEGRGGVSAADVESLFARIRAGREQAANRARKTLFDHAPGTSEFSSTAQETSAGLTGDATASAETLVARPPTGGPGPAEEGEPAVSEPGSSDVGGDNGAPVDRGTLDVLEQRQEAIGHIESSLARKLKRALQDEQNSLLDRLRSLKGPAACADVLPSQEEHPDRFVDASRPVLEEAARAGAELAWAAFGARGRRGALPEVADLADELGRSIVEPLRQRVEEAFSASGEDTTELADVLGAAYREWKTQRIEAVARDQVMAAYSRGFYTALPEGTMLRWVMSPAEGPCPDCEDNTLAGAQRKGEPWPTGQLYPPAHPGCRCALVPEVLSTLTSVGANGTRQAPLT
ncbi:MAG: DivIVA domain-containing protein [Acidimicrobiales bacterium]